MYSITVLTILCFCFGVTELRRPTTKRARGSDRAATCEERWRERDNIYIYIYIYV